MLLLTSYWQKGMFRKYMLKYVSKIQTVVASGKFIGEEERQERQER